MSWEDFSSLVKYFGVPGAMMSVLVWSLVKGWFVTGREVRAIQAVHQAREAEWVKRYDELKQEKDEWKESSLANFRELERTSELAHKAVNKLPSGKSE